MHVLTLFHTQSMLQLQSPVRNVHVYCRDKLDWKYICVLTTHTSSELQYQPIGKHADTLNGMYFLV